MDLVYFDQKSIILSSDDKLRWVKKDKLLKIQTFIFKKSCGNITFKLSWTFVSNHYFKRYSDNFLLLFLAIKKMSTIFKYNIFTCFTKMCYVLRLKTKYVVVKMSETQS